MPLKRSKKSQKPTTVEEIVAAYDAAARDTAIRWRAARFDHSPETIPILEEMLDELHRELSRPTFKKRLGLGANENEVESWANLWGIYLGETIREQLGGEWITGHEEAPSLLALELPDGSVLFPTARVFRRITEGAAENVAEYAERILSDSDPVNEHEESGRN